VKTELSDPQRKIYRFIERYTHEYGRPPTNREIGNEVGIQSTGHVDYHLTMLERKGYITRERRKSRAIRVLRPEHPQGIRITGTIAAGAPLDIFSDSQQDTLDLNTHAREYVLQVRGSSMIEDHIQDGDYVLVLPRTQIHDGDIIVATHKVANGDGGAATLKRIYKETGRIRLQPANSEMDPIYIPADEWDDEWEVQGKVTAVYRRC
jgi:repressor LexA